MKERIKLTSREKGVLLFQGIGTFLLFQIINLLLIGISYSFLMHNGFSGVIDAIGYIFGRIFNSVDTILWFYLIEIIEILLSLHVAKKAYNQFELSRVADTVLEITSGNTSKRLDFKVNRSLQPVVENINELVSSLNENIREQKESENSKDELIANISHDLRTPLTSIIGYLGLIESGNIADQEQFFKYTHVAYKKSLEMQNLVSALFEFGNLQSKMSQLNESEFDMTQMLDQLSADFELEANKRGIEIDVSTEPESIIMQGDTNKLGRVFNNLITNALKYGEGATHLWLSAKQLDDEIVVSISNNGTPIPDESLPQLFNRFYRVEDSRSKETGGSGLGLAISKSLVKMHDGNIEVKSDEHMTSFIIHFPITK
ncbi:MULTISPECIES: sensor histidine kinase [Lactobacillaceae]|uniref:sensor histidine kinase n=1 Tax=Lactobacillaceae TaxID=33958 RepID=UPI000C1B78A7|nr:MULTISPECIES: ATP-binding protein [Lactobacillaceae]